MTPILFSTGSSRWLLGVCLLAATVLSPALPAVAQAERPMLVEGTDTIYRRVLTRPGTELSANPQGDVLQRFPAFQPLYVFEEMPGWLRVGPSVNQPPQGWVPEPGVIAWKQNIVAAFTNAAGRSRQVMFQTEADLRAFMEHEAAGAMQEQYLSQADNGQIDPGTGVVAVEPAEFVSVQDQLYLMPILSFVEDVHPMNYEETLLMQLASVPLDEEADALPPTAGVGSNEFDVGIVFVLDTTQSMEPYINRTQRAVRKIVDDIRGTDVGELINFGAVAFRDNSDVVPGLDYRTRELIPLERRDDQTPVVRAIEAAGDVAGVSSVGFNEDSLAGVEDALDQTNWDQGGENPFDARIIVLVTDAGPKDPRDPNARSAIGPAELQRDAEGKGVVIMTLHLKTDAGQGNHDYAAGRYRALSSFGQQQYYYPIEGGSEDRFEQTVTRLVTALTDHVRLARGEETVLPPEETGTELEELGLWIRLRYLGARQGTRAPDVFEAWVSEKAVENPVKPAFEPRLLVTRNELATMAEFIGELVRLGEQMRDADDAASFFDQVQEVVVGMAGNPDTLVDTTSETLGGALEFLERLPYRSQIMNMDQETWGSSAMVRLPVLDGLHQKLTQYRKWLHDSSVWTSLYEGSPDGEHVFAMPFDILP